MRLSQASSWSGLKRSKAMAVACMVCYPGRTIKKLPQYDKKTSAEFNLLLCLSHHCPSVRQLAYGIGIARGKHFVRRVAPRQPHVLQVLLGGERHRQRLRQLQAEHVLGVVRYARRVTAAPAPVDLVATLLAPVGQPVAAGIQPGL